MPLKCRYSMWFYIFNRKIFVFKYSLHTFEPPMKKNKNYILLLIVIFSHVFGFYFLSTSMVSLRSNNFSNSSENSFDLLRFVKRRKEKDYISNAEHTDLAGAECNDQDKAEIQRSVKPFIKYLKRLSRFFIPEPKKINRQESSVPSKFFVSPPAFNVAYHCFLI